jgi:hypothetical protein
VSGEALVLEPLGNEHAGDAAVDAGDRIRSRVCFRTADVGFGIQDLPLQVRRVDGVEVVEDELSHARAREVDRGRRAQTAEPDDEDARLREPSLSFDSNLRQHDLPAVTQRALLAHDAAPPSRAALTRSSPARSW